ncbi:MAG TPA: hypothetical protein PK668_21405 [Myxococcota bacterium]|nr:hypothetical protein [Myxococcota bacterium]HRY96034.1 hypothetical protein [Myxococcota bacterium]HSA21426.1 hypothetical protein [Myxococcota bacterium]
MAIRQGVWDCPYCSKKGIPGPEGRCTGCGAPRDKDVQFYVPEGAAEVTDQAALQKARAAPDWHCGFCGADNPAALTKCKGCGGAQDAAAGARQVRVVPNQPVKPAPAPAPRRGKGPLFIILGVLLAIALGVWFFFFRTHAETLQVSGHQWERTIEVERHQWVREEAWQAEVPSGARVLGSRQEVHHKDRVQQGTERVKTGQKDLGNGYFEDVYEDRPIYEERPVYATKVSYEVERWKHERTERAAGTDFNPQWPPVTLREKEREAGRKEVLKVLLKSPDGDTREWVAPDAQRWQFYKAGQSYTAEVTATGSVSSLQAPAEKP